MENYRKERTVEQPCPCPFPNLSSDTPEVRVKDGSKIRNLMRFALSRMEEIEASAEQSGTQEGSQVTAGLVEKPCRQMVFTGTGTSVAKAITCVEILKRRVHGLHQNTTLVYRSVQEVWEPLVPDAGLDSLTVSRNVPCIWVLLSRDSLDSNQPGYQAPGSFDALWTQALKEEASAQRHSQKKKRGSRTGTGRGKGMRKHPGGPGETRKSVGHAKGGHE
ncbi:ribonuclease P protein subunit p25-like protein [Triplophysa rosa]|uniref:Ribonuclease P protein subunit p25-like protein n=1 Tax=Triplophysa rosa TaxID=992332 RepID=A0A9W8C4R1_TRIRA|nr:ribonuclease P protein subunit p25-like protein [Triplophysa rosa]KAI7806939.1 putative ribonuclease P protein subunit p25-like protein [Triplophysa rosa]